MTSRFASRKLVRRSLHALALAALFGTAPGVAAAQTLPVDLTWRAPPECPRREAVLARLRQLLGAAAETIAPVRAEGVIEETEDGFELRLVLEDAGERRVKAKRCNELGGAAAVALALLLNSNPADGVGNDSSATGNENSNGTGATDATTGTDTGKQPDTTKAAPPAETKPPVAKPEQSDSVETKETASEPRGWHVLLDAPALAIGVGPLPGVTYSPSLALGIEVGSWSLRALAQWPSTQTLSAEDARYDASVRRTTAALWGCRELAGQRLSLAACLELGASHLKATGSGPYVNSQPKTELLFEVGLGAIARLRVLDWLALSVGAGAQLELSRPRLVIENAGNFDEFGTPREVRQLGPAGVILFFGPEWIL